MAAQRAGLGLAQQVAQEIEVAVAVAIRMDLAFLLVEAMRVVALAFPLEEAGRGEAKALQMEVAFHHHYLPNLALTHPIRPIALMPSLVYSVIPS